jgi:succinoglycan biosynthesis transport protein ExoP
MHELPEQRLKSGEFLPSPAARREHSALPATYAEVAPGAPFDPGVEPESGGLMEYWRILRRRKGTLVIVSCLGALIGFLVTLPQTPIYQVRTSMEVLGLNQEFLNMKQADPLSADGDYSDPFGIQTDLKLLQSHSLIESVMTKLHNQPLPEAPPDRAAAWRKVLRLPDLQSIDARQEALAYASGHYQVRNSGQTRIIEITADSTSPQAAAAFAHALTNEFIEQNIESRWKTTERTGDFLTRQIEDIRIRLERSGDALQQYARQAGLLLTEDDKTNVSEQKLSQVQQALSSAQTDRIAKQSRWEMANSSPPDALPDVLNDLTLRDYENKLTDLRRQLAELRATYTSEHEKVKRVEVQIAPLQTAFDRTRSDILQRIKNEYVEAQRREKLLQADYATQRAQVTGEGEKEIHYNILKREADSNRQLYDSMLQQLKQASLTSALRASNIRVVDAATPPGGPYKPDFFRSTGLGLLAAIFLGSVLVVVQERADRSIQEPGETPVFLNLPELGVVPKDTPGMRIRLRYVGNKKPAEPTTAVPTPESPGVLPMRDHVELVTMQRNPSMVAESFRATLVSILFSGENGSRPRTMVITSSGPAEGKSTVVSNLGIAVAEVNHKVLLIDADLRKPRLHEIFNLKNDRGLGDLLRSKDPMVGLLEGAIQETQIPDLYVLTSGSRTTGANSLLYSNRMPELLQKLRTEFETIFIDTPPMLQISDARVLGRMADRVILVVRAGRTTRDAAIAARQRFFEDGTPMLGTILNDWNPRNSPNGYYGYGDGYYNSNYGNGYRTPDGSSKTATT